MSRKPSVREDGIKSVEVIYSDAYHF
jgi:hypothetical protein